ncbi:unnamed protein product [marine sediment metagenome]|uniref:Uncharacterized protein n=1 Tax=marine sediment metagenome TaxID=412755 RepID=X1HQU9_9ZZZZ
MIARGELLINNIIPLKHNTDHRLKGKREIMKNQKKKLNKKAQDKVKNPKGSF